MAKYEYDIAILGGGAAGLTVASGAAQLGAKTLLIEKEKELGGDCLHFGCVPSKTLIKTAHVRHLMASGAAYGLPEVALPEVDFQQVADRIRSVVSRIQVHDSVERFCGFGVEVCFGEARFTDEHSVDLDGRIITAKNWLITTGSSAAAPPLPGLDKVPYLTNREIFYLDKLPESLIILGAGPIAIEMAQAFCRLGSRVTVLQRSDQILSKEDSDLAATVQTVLEQEGVTFHLGCTMVSARDLGDKREVNITTADGQNLAVQGAEILVALGRKVNVDGLGLNGIDLEYNRRGIVVDNRLRTSHKHIYAAGDVIGGYQFTHAAGYEGGIVVSNAVFHLPRKLNYSWMPWCTFTDPELASIGLNEKRAKEQGIEYRLWTEPFSGNDRGLAEGEETGKVKLLLDLKGKPLGVQILGPHAGDLLGEWVAVLNSGMKLSGLAGAIHAYPTLAEINKRVVGNIFSEKIFSDKVKKALKFFFRFQGSACTPAK